MVSLDALKFQPNNPRKITEEALSKLANSIQRDPQFMVLRPIVVDKNNIVIGGNQRLAACRKLGMNEAPDEWVRFAEDLTEEQIKRFILVDNAPSGMAGDWDFDLLSTQWGLDELEELGFDLSKFDSLQEEVTGNIDDDEVPEIEESISVIKELYKRVLLISDDK